MLPQTGGSSSKFENYIASEAITSGNIVDVYNDNGTNFARNASSSTPMTINISGTSLGYALPIYTQSDHWKYITFTDMSGVSTGGGTPTITITPYKITSGYVKTTGTPQTFNMPTLPASQSGFTYSTHTSVKLTDNVFCIMVDVFWLHSTTGREQSYALFGIFQINESLTITQLQTYTWDTQWNDTNTGAHYGAMTYVPSAGTLRCALFRARPTVNDCLYRAAAITINQSTWNITAVTATSGNL